MTSWWAKAVLVGSIIAAVCLPLGALGTRAGLWSFSGGFLLLAVGVVLASIALVVGVFTVINAGRNDRPADRSSGYTGIVIGAVILGIMGLQFYTASTVPQIHNISTDVDDPPAFDAVVALRGEGSNPLDYDAAEIAGPQQSAYPWVTTLQLPRPPAQVLAEANVVLQEMGMEVVSAGAESVEATDTTFWFGFKDDVVVRVRPADDGGSRVDVRSVSRVGLSDLGTNARRIGQILDRLGAG